MHLNEHRTYAHHQDWLWNNAALEGQSHIVILWNMVIDRRYHATALNECQKGTHPEDWLCGTICFEARWALHHMSMGDKSSIIDEVETFLFTIWLEELKGIYEKSTEHTTMSLCTASYEMHVWMTDWVPRRLMITCTWRVLFQLEASSWLINNLDGYWHDAHNQSEDNSQKKPREKILHDESSSTTLGGMVKLDERCKQ